jgi:hypothetical protein
MRMGNKFIAVITGAAVAGAALATALTLTGSALAASSPNVTAYSRLPALLKADLAQHPGGSILNSHEITFDNGHIVVGSGIDVVCPTGYVCLNTVAGYLGDFAQFSGPKDQDIPIHAYIPNVASLRNRTQYGAYLRTPSIAGVCYPAGASAPDIGKPYSGYPYLYLQHLDNC